MSTLPEFRNPQQLAQWRVTAAKTAPQSVAAKSTAPAFFTGKPYDATSGNYVFKYRNYNPGLARWTSTDPSGFPDGANNNMYAAAPTSQLDPDGLYTIKIAGAPLTINLSNVSVGVTVKVQIPGSLVNNGSKNDMTVTYTGSQALAINATILGTGVVATPTLSIALTGTIQPNYNGAIFAFASYTLKGIQYGLSFQTWE